jgi:hypothetical protein
MSTICRAIHDYVNLELSCVQPVLSGKSLSQNAPKLRQRRSRCAQDLNVPEAYASVFRSLRPSRAKFLSILNVQRMSRFQSGPC